MINKFCTEVDSGNLEKGEPEDITWSSVMGTLTHFYYLVNPTGSSEEIKET